MEIFIVGIAVGVLALMTAQKSGVLEGISRGKFRELLIAGQSSGLAEEGEEVRALSFVSDGQAAVAEEPSDRPLDLPAVPTKAFARLDAWPRDARDEPALA